MAKNTVDALKANRKIVMAERTTVSIAIRMPLYARATIVEKELQGKLKNLAFLLWLVEENYVPRAYEGVFDESKAMLEELLQMGSDFHEAWMDGALIDVFDYTEEK